MREIVVPTFISLFQPIARTMEQLAQVGVKKVELHGDAPQSHINLRDESEIDALYGAMQGLPLEIHSIHCTFSQPTEDAWDISHPDEQTRATAVDNMSKAIRTTASLKARHITIHPGAKVRNDASLLHSRESIVYLAEAAESVGVKIAIENLPPDSIGDSLAEMKALLEGLDPSVVGFCLDTGHAMLGKDTPQDYIDALGDRIIAIHWHSNDGQDDLHLVPDINEPRWQEFIVVLDRIGYDLPITLEAAPPITMSLKEALQPLTVALQSTKIPN